MLHSRGLRALFGLCLLNGVLHAQCYDLTSLQLYDVKGRFQEHWDKPIWNAQPWEGNFKLDELPWLGGLSEFIIFTIGQVQKTQSGWVPLHTSRVPEIWCEITPQRSSIYFCYSVPYQTPPPQAFRVAPNEYDLETWSLNRDGLLHYTHRTHGDRTFDHTHNFGSTFDAVLDLNTGAYSAVGHDHSNGHYTQRIPEGVELWRETTLSAVAKLVPQPCPASLRRSSLGGKNVTPEVKAPSSSICAVVSRKSVEFIVNPRKLDSPRGCIVLHEEPIAPAGSTIAKAPEQP